MYKLIEKCALIALLTLIGISAAFAQKNLLNEEAFSGRMPESIGNLKASGAVRNLSNSEQAKLPNHGIYDELGLKSFRSRQYSAGTIQATAEVLEFKHAASAFSAYSLEITSPGKSAFYSGKYLILLSSKDESKLAEIRTATAAAAKVAMDSTEVPFLVSVLPAEGKTEGSEKYILGSAGLATSLARVKEAAKTTIDFTGGTQVAMAEYGKMALLIVEYQTPQFATDGAASLQQQFDGLNADEKKKTVLRRVGNYVVEAINVEDPKAAEALIGKIKYQPKVYWEGKDIKALPETYRPVDPWIVQESIRTGRFVVAAFYWIGAMGLLAIILGIFTGAGYFYWRRARNRKEGHDREFTDAGGMTRLRIDQDLIEGGDGKARYLGEGN